MMTRLNSLAGSRVCLHCLVPTAQADYCHECGPAFRSLSSWGYFRMPDETGVIPAHERDAYGDFGGATTFRSARRATVPPQSPADASEVSTPQAAAL